MLKTIYTAGMLIIKDNKVLLVKHTKKAEHLTDTYGFPAGRIEEGEDAINCAIRELKEETGLITTKTDLIPLNPVVGRIQRKTEEVLMPYQVYLCKNHTGEQKASDEATLEWIPTSKLQDYNLLPNVFELIQEGLELLKN